MIRSLPESPTSAAPFTPADLTAERASATRFASVAEGSPIGAMSAFVTCHAPVF
jgi:hypothetical protein